MKSWQEIPIQECGEPLVSLTNSPLSKIQLIPFYYYRGITGALNHILCRESVYEKLRTAANHLPENHSLLIWDAWRPYAVQQYLYDEFKNTIKRLNPIGNVNDLGSQFVSIPSIDVNKPSPHFTGGSVDLTILDKSGKPLEMGTAFDHFGDESNTQFFSDNISSQGLLIHQNRKLLLDIMVESGFQNYDMEWWHFDYGNQFWGAKTGEIAKYGLINF
ncbi:MAG: M15 family metallopeptidase [Cyclobacteriaceae bacterium]